MHKTLPKNVISFFPHFPHFEILSHYLWASDKKGEWTGLTVMTTITPANSNHIAPMHEKKL